ncbi:hypothetical protein ALP26_101831 [Pseudomonas savastanoi pv. glycinea]|uniref:Uncharacterized protein n=1 Tax=Pseudomonas savastanoi pv. glycinea TaxID=318 RepID=A0A0P9RFE3_PSESG|nr:Unknown protein sequence [Pseudomonas savastanoi pv. glycinea]KPC31362.1 Unknown protein sequence [Pseudomonas savastanoi pv. glycinea]KPC42030.1 Unknown protein sequence [Pseudomonas savastanoi pv. glycinea]KPC50887.1 Unknown protein sequence [Pseudomonas savastanoi pv. glycinea]KPX41622.1 hypothetical protein ALO37_101377 [Pseudomonas savastanoi pv. glycinea]
MVCREAWIYARTTSEQHSIARPFGIHNQNLWVDDKRAQLQQITNGDLKGESGDTRG